MNIIGGIATTFLSGYLKEFADIIVSGDAGFLLPDIIEALLSDKSKEDIYSSLEGINGIYPAPTLNNGDNILTYRGFDKLDNPAHTVILSDNTEFSNRGLIEVSRGCRYDCAFCLIRKAYGEYRPIPAENIIKTARKYLGLTDRLGLVAATLTNHPDFKSIIKELNIMNFKISFSSFRIETLDDEFLELIIKNENKTLVIAPETASLDLKKMIGKNIPRNIIINSVKKSIGMGIKRLKLYFIIGFPGEKMEDIKEIIDLVKEIWGVSQEKGAHFGYIPEIIVDINPLVPKPMTKFQHYQMEDVKSIKKKMLYLKKTLQPLGRVFVYGESPRSANLQYRIGRGLISYDELLDLSKV